MILTMEQSIERQIDVYGDKIAKFEEMLNKTKNARIVEQMYKQIEKQKYKVKEVTKALIKYRRKHEDD